MLFFHLMIKYLILFYAVYHLCFTVGFGCGELDTDEAKPQECAYPHKFRFKADFRGVLGQG